VTPIGDYDCTAFARLPFLAGLTLTGKRMLVFPDFTPISGPRLKVGCASDACLDSVGLSDGTYFLYDERTETRNRDLVVV